MRGYDRGEVDALLAEVADDYEGALRETDRLRQEVARLESALAEHRSEEKSLKNTLVSAQRLADELRETGAAGRPARDQGGRGPRRPDWSRRRSCASRSCSARSTACKTRRRETETSVEAIINALKNTLDFVREQDARDRDDKIRLMRPRHADSCDRPRAGRRPSADVRSQNG